MAATAGRLSDSESVRPRRGGQAEQGQAFKAPLPEDRRALPTAAATYFGQQYKERKVLSTNGHFHFNFAGMPISKDTLKAIVVISIALLVLIGLLAFANAVRPHP
jgi:hypothetical protein